MESKESSNVRKVRVFSVLTTKKGARRAERQKGIQKNISYLFSFAQGIKMKWAMTRRNSKKEL